MMATLTFPITHPLKSRSKLWLAWVQPKTLMALLLAAAPIIMWFVIMGRPVRIPLYELPSGEMVYRIDSEWQSNAIALGFLVAIAMIFLLIFASSVARRAREKLWVAHIKDEIDANVERLKTGPFRLIGVRWSNQVQFHTYLGGSERTEVSDLVIAFERDGQQVRILLDQSAVKYETSEGGDDTVSFPGADWWYPAVGETTYEVEIDRAVIRCADPTRPPEL